MRLSRSMAGGWQRRRGWGSIAWRRSLCASMKGSWVVARESALDGEAGRGGGDGGLDAAGGGVAAVWQWARVAGAAGVGADGTGEVECAGAGALGDEVWMGAAAGDDGGGGAEVGDDGDEGVQVEKGAMRRAGTEAREARRHGVKMIEHVGVSSWGVGGFGAFVAAAEGVGEAGERVVLVTDGAKARLAAREVGVEGVDVEAARFHALWREGAGVEPPRVEGVSRVVDFVSGGAGVFAANLRRMFVEARVESERMPRGGREAREFEAGHPLSRVELRGMRRGRWWCTWGRGVRRSGGGWRGGGRWWGSCARVVRGSR